MGMMQKQVYDLVTTKSGFKGRMRLAIMSGISSTRALDLPDSEETLARLVRAANEIVGEDISSQLVRR